MSKKTPKALARKIKGLLYKKEMQEHKVAVAKNGTNVSMGYYKALEEELKNHSEYSLEYHRISYEILQVKTVANDWISDFKEFERYYTFGLAEEIKETMGDKAFNKLDFKSYEEDAKEMARHEIYGTVVRVADNIELPKIIDDIKEYIVVIDELYNALIGKYEVDDTLTELDKCRIRKELFDLSLHKQTLEKRLNERTRYYVEQFLPMYEKDMKECETYLDTYLTYLNLLIASGVDPQLRFLLEQYENHKDDKEQLWLFFTALRARLGSIALHLKRESIKPNGKSIPTNLKDYVDRFAK
jgi:hypothetical protein